MARAALALVVACALAFAGAGGGGCAASSGVDGDVLRLTALGEYGRARSAARGMMDPSPASRSYVQDRLRLVVLALADGLPGVAEWPADELYDALRTQGLNADRTAATFFVGEEGARIWKGEPFEQAMAYAAVAVLDGLRGDWGNMRASSASGLFLLRDFVDAPRSDESGESRRVLVERAARRGDGGRDAFAYRPVASDFELGLALQAVAARRLGETEEARDLADRLASVAPRLGALSREIAEGSYNTVFVVEYGLGPERVRTGTDGVVAAYRARTRSGDEPLVVRVAGGSVGGWQAERRFPVCTDVNRLSRDIRWAGLEPMREAKSALGTGLLVGGAVVASQVDSDAGALAGLGLMLGGLLSKATAGADTRHVGVLPQRSYVALATVPEGGAAVSLSIPGVRGGAVELAWVPPPTDGVLALRYVRLPMETPAWATSGRSWYVTDATPVAAGGVSGGVPGGVSGGVSGGGTLPWILGGRDVRTPTPAVLASYHAGGLPETIGVGGLLELYRAEGVSVVGVDADAPAGGHVLEGGSWLFTPEPGSVGYSRLFGVDRGAYAARSREVRGLSAVLQEDGSR